MDVQLSWNPVDGADSYQLVVVDRTDAETIVDAKVPDSPFAVAVPEERRSHDLSMRVRPLLGDSWGSWTDFRPLPLEVTLGEAREPLSPLSADAAVGLLLVFTIDTECSVVRQPNPNPERVVDELIFGDFGDGSRRGGIGLHMDLLEHFGFRGSFFVDVLMEFAHSQAVLERVVEAIIGRGHEVELHVHPEHLLRAREPQVAALARDLRGGAIGRDSDVFRRLMELSVDLFERRVGRRPVAYRAGGYRIADIHFPVLDELGIRIDSSVQPYFHSQVADWMRVRTQPFWVDGVLESPPTYIILNEKPGEWETRGFTPNSYLGDPVFALEHQAGKPPHVITFVSHSFQLLQRHDSDAPDEVAAYRQRLRSVFSPGSLGQKLAGSMSAMRTFGPEVDDGLVAAVAGVLRRVADRPDARCVTYAELAGIVDRHWHEVRYPSVDPVPLLDRNRGSARVTGSRVLDSALLSHLASREPAGPAGESDNAKGWLVCCEDGSADDFYRRLSSHASGLARGETLRLRLRTLGVAPPETRGVLPPLAEVLFPVAAVEAVVKREGGRSWRGLPWDGATFKAWLSANGFTIVEERAVPRPAGELAAVEPFTEKLTWLDRSELEIAALELELRPNADLPAVSECPHIDPGALPEKATAIYGAMQPGEETRLRMPRHSHPATRTTHILACFRAGLEVVGQDGDDFRLLRPLNLSDIRRFAGFA